MLKEEKSLVVKKLQNIFSDYSSVIIFHYKGLSVSDLNILRSEIRKCDSSMQVVKNTLASIALKDYEDKSIIDLFKGPSAIAWGNNPIAISKVLYDFAKSNENLILVGGVYEGKKISQEEVKQLANMPSLDEIKAKLIAIIKTPATNIVGLLQKPASMLAAVLSQYSKK